MQLTSRPAWKHEIQMAHLRRRAAMSRAVFPNPSARANALLAGLIDRALSHWVWACPLDGGDDDDDADAGTDTATLDVDDVDDDIASVASQQTTSLQLVVPARSLQIPSPSSEQFTGRSALMQPTSSALKLANRRKSARFLTDFAAVCALSLHTSVFVFEVLDLAHT